MFAPRRAFTFAASALLAAGCASTPASTGAPIPHPDVNVHERTIHYDIVGSTGEQITASLSEGAPRIDWRPFRGTTHWNVRWRFRYGPSGFGCGITDVDVDLQVTTTLPRWEPPPGADRDLVERWTRYRSALEAHEAGHRDLAVAAANEIRLALATLRGASCRGLSDEANARGHETLARYREKNRRYDRETGHGRTQGATWPPPAGDEAGSIHAGSRDP